MGMETDKVVNCYCGSKRSEPFMLQCERCRHLFHMGCLKNGTPSPLEGDIFFYLTCARCGTEEICKRIKLQWLQVLMLSLYNMQLQGYGKCGYFRWKSHICTFIDRHWNVFFGMDRKKTHTWHGTVAGTLSAHCPQYFRSGTHILKESGWWTLAENKPPSLDTISVVKPPRKSKCQSKDEHASPLVEGLRTRNAKTSIQAAIELRVKRDTLQEAKQIRRATKSCPDLNSLTTSSLGHDRNSVSPLTMKTETVAKQDFLDDGDSNSSLGDFDRSCSEKSQSANTSFVSESFDQSSQMSVGSSKSDLWLTVRDLTVEEKLPEVLFKDDDDDDSDLEIDPCAITPPMSPMQMSSAGQSLPNIEDILSRFGSRGNDDEIPLEKNTNDEWTGTNSCNFDKTGSGKSVAVVKEEPDSPAEQSVIQVKEEPMDEYDCNSSESVSRECLEPHLSSTTMENANYSDEDSERDESTSCTTEASSEMSYVVQRKRKRGRPVKCETEPKPPEPRYLPLSLYEEKQLLKKLKSYGNFVQKDPEANRLKRKLIVRQLKRERGVPLFDLDNFIGKVKGIMPSQDNFQSQSIQGFNCPDSVMLKPYGMSPTKLKAADQRILDRFQTSLHDYTRQQAVSFLNRLVGTEDDQMNSIPSPYTARLLKPFIRRDNETQPQKLRLLREIQAYPHRNDRSWVAPPAASIDYCYVRPQHIPPVNALCREFFWPGIDLSECLQYPDFSCVVLYRKFVIGFAFMVPDVKYNEAYISFLFTHPEWRRAGIAKFMLYHLIQTCMGKNVTLHVSASNTALLLYQKFGFKTEEFILDFYDKYFPEDSQECRHAFFLRLRR